MSQHSNSEFSILKEESSSFNCIEDLLKSSENDSEITDKEKHNIILEMNNIGFLPNNFNILESKLTPKSTYRHYIKKIKSQKISRNSSVNRFSPQHFAKINSKRRIKLVSNKISKDAMKCTNLLQSSKLSGKSGNKKLSKADKIEIQNFFNNKQIEFESSLKYQWKKSSITSFNKFKQDKARRFNYIKDIKSEKILNNQLNDEVDRLKQSQKWSNKQFEDKMLKNVQEVLKKLEKKKLIENLKRKKELKAENRQEKELIMDKIKNYYRDKIDILKEKLETERMNRRIINYEQKKVNNTIDIYWS